MAILIYYSSKQEAHIISYFLLHNLGQIVCSLFSSLSALCVSIEELNEVDIYNYIQVRKHKQLKINHHKIFVENLS